MEMCLVYVYIFFLLRGERRVITPLHLQDTRKSCSEWGCWLFLLVCKIKCMYIHILHAYTWMCIIKEVNEFFFRRNLRRQGNISLFSVETNAQTLSSISKVYRTTTMMIVLVFFTPFVGYYWTRFNLTPEGVH